MKEQYEKNLAALDKYKRNDPDRLKQLGTEFLMIEIVMYVWIEKESAQLKNQANQWTGTFYSSSLYWAEITDNVFVTKQWIINKNPSCSDADLNKQFNIPEELDSIP